MAKIGQTWFPFRKSRSVEENKLNESHRLALKYLESKRPEFVSAEEVGREIGDHLGMEGWGSAFGLPLCNKLVSVGLVVQNDAGHYAAVTK
ncbi:hypothetical protein [Pseudomonas baetica]|uniref:hypothetical protein n=1 Tax=Pseudomonas baetica TaxID=674054 RepID=UPI0024063647|nr:hypothetical protein [Pseudomonas baetica]MDF9778960.1 hypothetical protein [Pseudomonas baetica]